MSSNTRKTLRKISLLSVLITSAGILIAPTPANAAACVVATSKVGTIATEKITAIGSCDWTVPAGVTQLEVLVVGGGGAGGGTGNPGAGGAGGVLHTTSYAVTDGQPIPVTVGAGGLIAISAGNNGADSTFNEATASGGGGGAGWTGSTFTNAKAGGSGGGGMSDYGNTRVGGLKTVAPPNNNSGNWSAYGNPGGAGNSNKGGGGGGAGSAGTNAYQNADNNFGAGKTLMGITVAAGGNVLGGGGGIAGAVNTGNGGGDNANGGSGVVVIRYTSITYGTATFNSNFGTPTVTTQSIALETSTNLNPNTFIRTGYTFAGWATNSDGTGTTYTDSQLVSITTGITLYAQWTAGINTVVFNSNGGSGSIANQSITSGTPTALSSNTFIRDGYTLANWATNSDGTGTSYTDSQTISITSGMTLYAQWAAGLNVVVFNSNGGSGTMTNQVITSLTNVALASNTFTRAGYTFVGWNTNSDGTSGTAYTNGQLVSLTNGMTLHARWSVTCSQTIIKAATTTTIKITTVGGCVWAVPTGLTQVQVLVVGGGGGGGYGGNGGGGGGGGVLSNTAYDVSEGQIIPISIGSGGLPPTLYGPGANGSDTKFNNEVIALGGGGGGGSANNTLGDGKSGGSGGGGAGIKPAIGVGGTATQISYSNWNAFGNRGGTGVSGGGAGGGGGGAGGAGLNGSDKGAGGAGKTILGISVSAGGSQGGRGPIGAANTGNGGGSGSAGGSGLVAIQYAAINTWTASFNSNFGTPTLVTQTMSLTSATNLLANTFTRAGYVFAGWSLNTDGTGTVITDSASVLLTSDTIYYAKWTANSNTVVFNSNSGTGTMSNQSITSGIATALSSNIFTRTGYTFAGWNTNADGSSGSSFTNSQSVTLTVGMTIYAKWSANALITSFNSQGGSSVSSVNTVTAGSITSAPTAPTRTDYTFSGWSITTTGSVVVFPYTHGKTANFTLYAIWNALPLTITYDSQGGSLVASGSTVKTGTLSLAPTAPTKSGYAFSGWSTTTTGSIITYPFIHGNSAEFTMYAIWIANRYVLTFVYNSADGGTRPATADFTTAGTHITLPTPTRSGYTFMGWFSDLLLVTSIGAAGANYSPAGSSLTPTAYAKWSPISYAVTYSAVDATGGLVPVDANNYNIGNIITIKGNSGSLLRTGYTFAGWTVALDGTGTVLASGSTLTTPSSDVNLYASWIANTYTITYSGNGATGLPAAATSSYSTAAPGVSLSEVGTMIKTGFTFSGWSTSPTGSVILGTFTTAENVNLYAIWSIKSISITFSTGIAGNVAISNFPTDTALSYGSVLTLAGNITSSVSINGIAHAFVGWSHSGNIYRGGDTYLIGEIPPTFTAEWVKVFAVRYIMNGGTATANSSEVDAECATSDGLDLRCTENQDISTNPAPTRIGFTFAQWTNQGGATVTAAAITKITATNYLFYANWTPIDYAVTYNTAQGSTAPDSFTKRLGETFTIAAAPTKVGYNFVGWSNTTSVLGAGTTYYVATSPVNLTAQWTPKVYTVTYDWNGGSGSTTSNSSYTVGNSALGLPIVGDHIKDGYTFAGWSTESNGTLISGGYTPIADATLYAIWGTGSYTFTYDAAGGSVVTASAAVVNGTSLTLPTPTRANFIFDGWYTATTGGSKIGGAGVSHLPTQSRTLSARWIQASVYGISPSALTRIGTTTASSGSDSTFISSNANSAVSVTVPAGSLPNNTNVYFDLVGDFTRAQSVLVGNNGYIISLVVSWLAPDGTVPNTASNKPISVTMTNSSIKSGASVYGIVAGSVTLLGTATQNGTVTVSITSDPEVVVVATKPGRPTNVAATANINLQSDVSWIAPVSDGGAEIVKYTVTSNNGQTCTTSTLSCIVSGLTDGIAYTFAVTATNAIGVSDPSNSVTTASKPGAPTSVTASAGATRQSVISWTAPTSNGGSVITGYTATTIGGLSCSTITTSCTVTGLADATSYTFTVISINVIGSSEPSPSATAITATAAEAGGDSAGNSGSGTTGNSGSGTTGNGTLTSSVTLPFLKSLTGPQLHLVNSQLICTADKYYSGFTADGYIQSNAATLISPTEYIFNLLFNGIVQTTLATTSKIASTTWDLVVLPIGSTATCSITVSYNSITTTESSSLNTLGLEVVQSAMRKNIAIADADYTAAVSKNSKVYQKTLVSNRTLWRNQMSKIRSNYLTEKTRISKLPSTKETRARSLAALRTMTSGQKKSAADYAASKPEALLARDRADKSALDAKLAATAKASNALGSFLESIGHGVLIS